MMKSGLLAQVEEVEERAPRERERDDARCVGAQEPFSCSEEAARLLDAKDRASTADRQRRRERVALGVFAVLVLAGFIVLTSYISHAGHGLNVAATSIDDMAGDMAGYDVVLFEGTVVSEPSSTASAEESPDTFDEAFDGRYQDGSVEDGRFSDDGQTRDDSVFRSGGDEGDYAADGAISIDEARDAYESKEASVIEIDSSNIRDYASGRILMKDGHTYGIFSLTPDLLSSYAMPRVTTTKTTITTTTDASGVRVESVSEKETREGNPYGSVSELFAAFDPSLVDSSLRDRIETILDRFEAAGCDTVVALTSDPRPFSGMRGIDAVITFKERDRFPMSEVIDGTLYFDAPERGSVGVLMVAPGNVASTKVLAPRAR